MKTLFLAAAPLALLAACSGGASDGVEPGEWTMTMEVTDIEAPDAPPQAIEAMRQQPPQTDTQCITPEQATNMDGGIFAPQNNENCENMTADMSGGELAFSATCAVPGAGSMEMTLDGTYDRETINADMEMVMAQTPMGQITMRGTMTGERTGDCDA